MLEKFSEVSNPVSENKVVSDIDFSKQLDFSKVNYFEDEQFLGNVEKGREMTFTEADSGNVNPRFEDNEGYQNNCQTCVVVFEARLRGWDVEAKSFMENSNCEKLSENTSLAWLTSDGKHPKYIFNTKANSVDDMYQFIADTVKPGERYTMQGYWRYGICDGGHIISVFREPTGNLVFYDPQIDKIYNERSIKKDVLNEMQKGNTEDTTIKLLRIDNLKIDKDFVDPIVKGHSTYV